jgi:hypothetical protein
MPKTKSHFGAPSHSPKDEPTADRDTRHAASHDELKERSADNGKTHHQGRRNGSSKHR